MLGRLARLNEGLSLVPLARGIASFRQVGRGIRLDIFNRAYDYARRTRLTNLFEIPVEELWSVPLAEARRRLGMPDAGMAREFYPEITLDPGMVAAIRAEWKRFGITR